MQNAKNFVLWFLEELPEFLLSDPICYFMGFAFLGLTVWIFQKLKSI